MLDGLLLRKNALWPLAKRVLEPLGLMAEASATDATIQKKKKNWIEYDCITISNEEMEDILKISKYLK